MKGKERVKTGRNGDSCGYSKLEDYRRHDFFIVDNDLVDKMMRVISFSALGVYVSMSRHANKKKECWPGVPYLMKEMKAAKRTISRAIKELVDHRMIKVKRTPGGRNTYQMLACSQWKVREEAPKLCDNCENYKQWEAIYDRGERIRDAECPKCFDFSKYRVGNEPIVCTVQ